MRWWFTVIGIDLLRGGNAVFCGGEANGSNLTQESCGGFPPACWRARLRDAHRNHRRREGRHRPLSRRDERQSQTFWVARRWAAAFLTAQPKRNNSGHLSLPSIVQGCWCGQPISAIAVCNAEAIALSASSPSGLSREIPIGPTILPTMLQGLFFRGAFPPSRRFASFWFKSSIFDGDGSRLCAF